MTTTAIDIRNLQRYYGKVEAVQDLSLTIPSGSLYGLIGPNGAGKTTTLRMLAGLLEPSGGEIFIYGQPITNTSSSERLNRRELQRQIGYMPDFFGVYEDLLVWEYLDFFARCHNLPAERRQAVTTELLELVDLHEKRDAYVQTLSRGMRQRLCLAHTLVHDPQILLLDEPASGLDPRARVEMRELLRELSKMGKTIILSSHILTELAELCDTIGIIERGRLVASGSLETIQAQMRAASLSGGRALQIKFLSGSAAAAESAGEAGEKSSAFAAAEAFLRAWPGVGLVYRPDNQPLAPDVRSEGAAPVEAIEFEFSGDETAAADLLGGLVAAGVRVAGFHEASTNLEEVFLRLTRGEVA